MLRRPPLPAYELAGPGPLRDRLVAAVLDGHKTATTSLHAWYEGDGADPFPHTGVHILVDSAGRGLAWST